MIFVLTLILGVVASDAYPVSYTSCGVKHEVTKTPTRIVTMTQGATEFMLALGLADKMVGTAYLHDGIWPKYATEYAKIPVLANKSYPTDKQIMDAKPDFIVASYSSAFRAQYTSSRRRTVPGQTKGIFSETQVGKCEGTGSVWKCGSKCRGSNPATCRPQLHAKGIGTYLFAESCEDQSLRPVCTNPLCHSEEAAREDTVYGGLRDFELIFKVDVQAIINGMIGDFNAAAAMVPTSGKKLKAVWLAGVRHCRTDADEEKELFVAADQGVPGLLMRKAGLENAFESKWNILYDKKYMCVKEREVIAKKPDVIIVSDASGPLVEDYNGYVGSPEPETESALSKIIWLYNNAGFCNLDALKGARFVQIPFSAGDSLGPRNGAAALDLAIASNHVRLGVVKAMKKSGVGSFDPPKFKSHINGLKCTLEKDKVKYFTVEDKFKAVEDKEKNKSEGGSSGSSTSSANKTASGRAQTIATFLMLVLSWFVAMLSGP